VSMNVRPRRARWNRNWVARLAAKAVVGECSHRESIRSQRVPRVTSLDFRSIIMNASMALTARPPWGQGVDDWRVGYGFAAIVDVHHAEAGRTHAGG